MGQQQWCGQPSGLKSEFSQIKQSYICFNKATQAQFIPERPKIVLSVRQILGKFKTSKKYPRGQKQPAKMLENDLNMMGNSDQKTFYKGEWSNDLPHGLGTLYFADGSLYEGYMLNGVPQGEGRYILSNGVYYEGAVKQGSANGFGLFVNHHKDYSLSGEWKDDVPHGKCKEVWQNSYQCPEDLDSLQYSQIDLCSQPPADSYEGDFVYGVKEGNGKYTCKEYQYWGQFKDNMMWGKGKIKFSQEEYQGDFIQNLYWGRGTYIWKDGSRYSGQWQKGEKHGEGYFIGKDGRSFDGMFVRGQREGKGAFFSRGGQKSQDFWMKNKRLFI